MNGRVRVFIACSLDGFIAGPDDDLGWLAPPEGAEVEDTFGPFLEEVGAILMGRRTYDVVSELEGWAYGDRPIFVLTSRPLVSDRPTVRSVAGPIGDAVAAARAAAGDGDVYLDGGQVIRYALDAGLVDELAVTLIPRVLGAGTPLFAGTEKRHDLELLGQRPIGGGFVELRYRSR